jgi:prevent-host-death family protein
MAPGVRLWRADVAPIETQDAACYRTTMKTITARDANQNFSKVLAEVEQGETVLITKNGKTVAELRPRPDDPREDPVWRAKFEHMIQLMATWEETGYRVGKITEDDKYGDAPV